MFWKRAYEDSMPDHVDRCLHCCTNSGRKDDRPAANSLTYPPCDCFECPGCVVDPILSLAKRHKLCALFAEIH